MILMALGANLPGPAGTPCDTVRAALEELTGHRITVVGVSPFYRSAPVPPSGQPDFVNAVACIETHHDPFALINILHSIEGTLGRTRAQRWEARVIDLDLIDYHQFVTIEALQGRISDPASGPQRQVSIPWHAPLTLPHPRAHERAFVLMPIAQLVPEWRHPALNETAEGLLRRLAPGQICTPLEPRPEGRERTPGPSGTVFESV